MFSGAGGVLVSSGVVGSSFFHRFRRYGIAKVNGHVRYTFYSVSEAGVASSVVVSRVGVAAAVVEFLSNGDSYLRSNYGDR